MCRSVHYGPPSCLYTFQAATACAPRLVKRHASAELLMCQWNRRNETRTTHTIPFLPRVTHVARHMAVCGFAGSLSSSSS